MRAAVLQPVPRIPGHWLSVEDMPLPEPQAGHVLLKVSSCGVCRTDLHIVEGDLPPLRRALFLVTRSWAPW